MVHSFGCKRESWQLCLACGAQVCGCAGLARGQCPECYRGLLTGFYRVGHKCGYKGCGKAAVAATPRVGFACLAHAIERGGYKMPADTKYQAAGTPTYHTQTVLRALGWQGRADIFYALEYSNP